jgi:hypothetical protein
MRAGTRRGARWLAGGWAVAVGLAATLMAGPAQAASSPFTYSSVAWTGTSAIVAGTDSKGDLYFFSEGFLIRKFYGQLVASGQHFTGAPAIAVTGSTISIAVSQGSQVDDWYELGGTGRWHEQVVAAARGTSYGPAAIGWTGSRVTIAAADTINGLDYLDYWYESAGATTWHEQLVSTGLYGPGYNTAYGPSIGWTGRHVIIAFIDRIGSLDYFYEDAGTTTWHKQLVKYIGFPSFADPSMAWTGSEIVITAIVQGAGVLDYWYEPAGTKTWHEQVVAQNIYAPPAITGTGGSVVITATSEHGNLEYWSQAAGTRTWHNQQVAAAPGVTGYANPSIALAHGAVIITAVERSSGDLDYWAGPGPWSEQRVAAG